MAQMTNSKESFLETEAMVTVKVSMGEDSQSFIIHKNFICYYSPYFAVAFNGGFIESETHTCHMEDVSPGAFALFVDWIYTQQIPCDERLHYRKATENLVGLWLLADRCLVPKLQNQALVVLDRERRRLNYRLASSAAQVYEETSVDSPFRRYFVLVVATAVINESIETSAGMPREMLVDVINVLKSKRNSHGGWVNFSPGELSGFFVNTRENKESIFRRRLGPDSLVIDLTSAFPYQRIPARFSVSSHEPLLNFRLSLTRPRRSQAMVTINVSLNHLKDTFIVHKNFICFYSPFFDAAFNGAFKEAETQVLDLEDTSPTVFGLFVNWLYTQRLEFPGGENISMSNLIDLWILGSRCLVPKIQNKSLELLDKRRIFVFSSTKFVRAYENTTEGSPLRRYIVAIAATRNGALTTPQDYPQEMLVDIVNYVRIRRAQTSEWIKFSKDELKGFYVDEQGAPESGPRVVGAQPKEIPVADSRLNESSEQQEDH
ncbi:hypothetical protein HYFRA_00008474 [Hymenoscyphus fraxineus]|uniref:BTB domain-containing protein n=1 Tax=Hymenoscyphus fraxineus TaxID=746836 RepID=A0A9N9KNK0_9HELO|nr:hypothetical protein HYFRA_00008474 [Hymenoscyphus fraxineus]